MTLNQRVIYYYQTFCGLSDIFSSSYMPTHIHVSSIHFGPRYIHLNNAPPDSDTFADVWRELQQASNMGIKIILMIGGAGGAYQEMFSDYTFYYFLLKKTLLDYPFIEGVDLDIEEEVSLDDVKMLITDLKRDFGEDFIISMAPVQSSLENDSPGIGGFIYKDIYLFIDYFNGQFYNDYSFEAYQRCIENGYPANKIVMGMIFDQDLDDNLEEIKKIKKAYPDFGGVFNWEYFDSPPDPEHPNKWCELVNHFLDERTKRPEGDRPADGDRPAEADRPADADRTAATVFLHSGDKRHNNPEDIAKT
jgi:hypothetical protein